MGQTADINFIAAGAGDRYGIAGGSYRILVGGEATGGAFAVIEMTVPAGAGPVPHRHRGFQENFVVLEGEVEMRSETGSFTASAGSSVLIPLDGPVHCFRNTGSTPAKLLCTVVPAGLDAMFRDAGAPLLPGEEAPAVRPGPEELARLQALAVKYGQELFPPDYFDAGGARQ